MPSAAARGNGLGVVRKQDVGDVRPHQPFDAAQQGGRFAWAGALASVVDPNQIEVAAAPGQFHTLLPQHMHAVARKERLSPCFHPGPTLVVAVAPPDAHGRPQPAQLGDTVFEGVMLVRDQIAGEHGQIGLHGIAHVDGAPDRRAGHEGPDVDITEVDNAQPIQMWR
jgi:hypothetical protein